MRGVFLAPQQPATNPPAEDEMIRKMRLNKEKQEAEAAAQAAAKAAEQRRIGMEAPRETGTDDSMYAAATGESFIYNNNPYISYDLGIREKSRIYSEIKSSLEKLAYQGIDPDHVLELYAEYCLTKNENIFRGIGDWFGRKMTDAGAWLSTGKWGGPQGNAGDQMQQLKDQQRDLPFIRDVQQKLKNLDNNMYTLGIAPNKNFYNFVNNFVHQISLLSKGKNTGDVKKKVKGNTPQPQPQPQTQSQSQPEPEPEDINFAGGDESDANTNQGVNPAPTANMRKESREERNNNIFLESILGHVRAGKKKTWLN